MTVTQEVPVSRVFEAYPTKPPQIHERILNWLFLMMETNNHWGQWAVAAVAAGAYLPLYNELKKFTISWLVPASLYTHNKVALSFVNQTQYLWPCGMANRSIIDILQGPSSVWGFDICYIFYLPLQIPINMITFLQECCIMFQMKEIC
jgi:hypothetical protein